MIADEFDDIRRRLDEIQHEERTYRLASQIIKDTEAELAPVE